MSKSTVCRKLEKNGFTIQEITEVVYGHPGTQAYYTILLGTKRIANLSTILWRLVDMGLSRSDAKALLA